MAFEVTKIKIIKNFTNELIRVDNLEKNQPYEIAPHQSIDLSVDIPWMMSAGDFGGQYPHLLRIWWTGTKRWNYLWQKDQSIINGRSLQHFWVASVYSAVGGNRDLVVADNGAFVYGLGASPYEHQVGPAAMAETGMPEDAFNEGDMAEPQA